MTSRIKDRAKFESFMEFESALDEYEKNNNVKMVKIDSKKMKEGEKQDDEPSNRSRGFPYRYAKYRCRYSGNPQRKKTTTRKLS